MLFQSLGSEYTYKEAWRHFLTIGTKKDQQKLQSYLRERYQGQEVNLFYKGRAALAAAISRLTEPGSKVAINGLTCYSVVQAVEAAGCEVVYVDVAPDDVNYGPDQLNIAFSNYPDIKVIIIQNTLGYPCDIVSLMQIARQNNASVIEDLAHSVGGMYDNGQEIGTVGDVTMLSFGREKAIDASNGGAMIVRGQTPYAISHDKTKKPSIFDQARDRWYPLLAWHVRALMPLKIGSLLLRAAYSLKLAVRSADGVADMSLVLPAWYCKRVLAKFATLPVTNSRRQKIAARYQAGLQANQAVPAFTLGHSGAMSIRYPLFILNKQPLFQAFRARGIHLEDIWYDTPVAPRRYAAKVDFPSENCPNTIKVAAKIINLPTHQGVTAAYEVALISLLLRSND